MGRNSLSGKNASLISFCPSGLGLGISPGLTSFNQGDVSDTHVSLGAGFKIGHEVYDRLQIYVCTIVSPFGYKLGTYVKEFGLVGIIARYFSKEQTPSVFVIAAGDIGVWHEGHEFNYHYSMGPRVGIGYEFAKHFNIEGSISWLFPGHADIKVSSYWILLSYEI